MAYLGKKTEETKLANRVLDTMASVNGSNTTMALSSTPIGVSNVVVFIDGVYQRPTTDYTLNGSTITFTTAPHNGATVYAITGGGEHIGTPLTQIGTDKFADQNVTSAKLSGPYDASCLTGALPAVDGSALTGITSNPGVVYVTSDPTNQTVPVDGVGTIHVNTTTGETFVCTDATANDTAWFNVGEGVGHIIPNVNPGNPTNPYPNVGSSLEKFENETFNITFEGGIDTDGSSGTGTGAVTHYMVDNISPAGALTVAAAEVAAGSAHTFTTQEVNSNTQVTFRVRTKDNDGAYSSGITVHLLNKNNQAPTAPTNTGDAGITTMMKNSTINFTFSGGVDPEGGAVSYVVDEITPGTYLSCSDPSGEVAGGSAHTFVTQDVPSNQQATIRVRTKDAQGNYSAPVVITVTILNVVYTIANGGTKIPIGDYYVHTFTSNSSFNVTQVGTDNTVEYLLVGNGGGGGVTTAGGGGAGQYLSVASYAISVSNYNVTIGAGGPTAGDYYNPAPQAASTTFGSITAIGGGGGGSLFSGPGGNGASGGGAGGASGTHSGGTGTNGNNGGSGGYNVLRRASGGGGGAASAGVNAILSQSPNAVCGNGGAGYNNSITGNVVGYAGGGGGGNNAYNYDYERGTGSHGGGDGCWPPGNGTPPTNHGTHGEPNTGGGGGGGGESTGSTMWGKNGGSGILVVKYKYKN